MRQMYCLFVCMNSLCLCAPVMHYLMWLSLQVNEALSDNPTDTLDFSMRQEVDKILKIGARIAVCMSKCALTQPHECFGCLALGAQLTCPCTDPHIGTKATTL